jgi:hypothetical protein
MKIQQCPTTVKVSNLQVALARRWDTQMLEPLLDSGFLEEVPCSFVTGDIANGATLPREGQLGLLLAAGIALFYYEPEKALRLLGATSLELACDRTPDADVELLFFNPDGTENG